MKNVKITHREPDVRMTTLDPWIKKLLNEIAVEQPHAARAMVTDRSAIGDFYLVDMHEFTSAAITKEEYETQIKNLSSRIGFPVTGTDLILTLTVAEKMHEQDHR